ncbi:MAG: hypothetical protein KBT46_06590 [Ruminococcus sp.]|nr:hypothetical protein [Candidatus Copronaster equi]
MKRKVKIFPLTLAFVFFVFSLSFLFIVLPKKYKSENEKRILSKFPQLTASSLTSGKFTSDLDTYLADHFPFRDVFVGINSYANLAMGQNGDSGVYKGKDGYLITAPEKFDPVKIKKNTKYISDFSRRTMLPTSFILVPTAGYIMDEKLPENHKKYYDDNVFSIVKNNSLGFDLVDLRENFKTSKDEIQLYYKTDHHLTSSGSISMYNYFCQYKKIEPAEFTLDKTVDGFYGTAYSKSGLWLEKPDDIEIWKSKSKTDYSVLISDGNKTKTSKDLYFNSHLEEMDKYPVFLDGNHGYVQIKNKNCHNGKRLLLIKDSYAHCFSTFLIENYEEIDMIDLRYYHNSFKNIIEDNSLNEILFVYGVENLMSSTDISWLTRTQ